MHEADTYMYKSLKAFFGIKTQKETSLAKYRRNYVSELVTLLQEFWIYNWFKTYVYQSTHEQGEQRKR